MFIGRLELQLDLSKGWEMSCRLRKWSNSQSAEVQYIIKRGPESLFEAKEQSFLFFYDSITDLIQRDYKT